MLPDGFLPDYVLLRELNRKASARIFEQNLTLPENSKKGLDLIEMIEKIDEHTEQTFVLVSISDEVLQTYAEALGIRLPIDRTDKREKSLLAKRLTFADPFPETHPFRRYDREKGELVSEYVEAPYQSRDETCKENIYQGGTCCAFLANSSEKTVQLNFG